MASDSDAHVENRRITSPLSWVLH